MTARRLMGVAALLVAIAMLAVAAGCGDDDGDDGDAGPGGTVARLQIEFSQLPGDAELTLQVAPDGSGGTAAFDDSTPAFGGEMTENNLTEIVGNTLEMQTFAPLGMGSMTVGIDLTGGVEAVRLEVRPVPEGATITAGPEGGDQASLADGSALVDLGGEG